MVQCEEDMKRHPFSFQVLIGGGEQKKLRNLRAESDGMLNLFS